MVIIMKIPLSASLLLASLISPAAAQTPVARIEVQADQVVHPVSRFLTGACIEDVNHEIYGGIYSQMLFGESFQEPPYLPPTGFKVLGGHWSVRGDELHAAGIPGDKLVSELPPFGDGEVGVEVFVTDRTLTNAGLILRVGRATRGMDTFDAYEVSLNAQAQYVLLGRHRQNWEHIKNTPCEIPIGQWVPLMVKLNGKTIEISVAGKMIVKYEDGDQALLTGTVGLRQFQPAAKYRNLWVKTGGEKKPLPFGLPDDAPPDVSGMWRAVRTGTAKGSFQLEQEGCFIGRHSQRVTFGEGQGSVGVENQGLNRWGQHFEAGRPYEGLIWAKAAAAVELFVTLESRDGSKSYAETKVAVAAGDWQRLTFSLTPTKTETAGRMTISLRQPSSVDLGYAFLQPGEWGRFKGLPIRRDVTQGLIDQGVTVLRYGGSMINHPEYRWKKMIGPRDLRPQHNGTWYPHSTNGWGILDFLDLCDAAGFLSIPAFNIDETPQDMADFMEYVNGPATSEWGRRRVADGHDGQYNLRYIQLGNEERVDETYYRKFQPLAEAIWARDPRIIIVVGDFAYGEAIGDPFKFRGAASQITTLAAHQQILQLARKHNREVWFDVHIGTDGPRPDFGGTFSFMDALEKLAEGAKHRVVIFEFNAGNHSQRRALANAAAINIVERDGRIPIALAANCLQPDGQNDNDWNQGLLFLNPAQVWLQPPGYVTQMYRRNYLPQLVKSRVTGAKDALDVTAKRSEDNRTLVLQVVNSTDQPVATQIHLNGFAPAKPQAQISELSGPRNAVNTAEKPQAIVPQSRPWQHGLKNGEMTYAFPANSITVLKLE
jgi:hypothetical protein